MVLRVESRTEPQAVVIALHGDVTVDGEEPIRSAYDAAVSGAARAIVIDLAGAEYINTSGISVLITLAMQAKQDGLPVAVSGASPHYRKVFELVRFSTFATMYDDEAGALADLA